MSGMEIPYLFFILCGKLTKITLAGKVCFGSAKLSFNLIFQGKVSKVRLQFNTLALSFSINNFQDLYENPPLPVSGTIAILCIFFLKSANSDMENVFLYSKNVP